MGFNKFQIFTQIHMLHYGFRVNRQFAVKIV
jgi:hypothetical protein